MALKLNLKPGEKWAINGAVVVNGDRRASLVVENKANVLRERDIMQEDDATSPARLIYLPVMMMALDPHCRATHLQSFEQRLTEFIGAVKDPEALGTCLKISAKVANAEYYKALSEVRKLIAFEEQKLAPYHHDTDESTPQKAGER